MGPCGCNRILVNLKFCYTRIFQLLEEVTVTQDFIAPDESHFFCRVLNILLCCIDNVSLEEVSLKTALTGNAVKRLDIHVLLCENLLEELLSGSQRPGSERVRKVKRVLHEHAAKFRPVSRSRADIRKSFVRHHVREVVYPHLDVGLWVNRLETLLNALLVSVEPVLPNLITATLCI